MSKQNSLLNAALMYADLGYPVFPCQAGEKVPYPGSHGFKDATTDLEQIEAWWTEHPKANIGLPTVSLIVVDIDGADNAWPNDANLDMAPGAISQTPRGGCHLIYRMPAGKAWRSTASTLAPNVDTRAIGGYIVVPPSATGDGTYTWAPSYNLDIGLSELPVPPDWLSIQLDRIASGSPATGKASSKPIAGDGNRIPSGQRNDTLARLAGLMRRGGMTEVEIRAALVQANATRCQPPMPDAEVEKIAWSVARYEPDQITVSGIEDWWGQLGDAGADRPWPELVSLREDTGEPPRFPVEALPPWLREMVAAVAEATQTPQELAGSVGLGVLALAGAGKVEVEPSPGWREPLSLFVAVALPPGCRKSAVFATMTKPLVAWERMENERLAPEIARATTKLLIMTKRLAYLQNRAAKGNLEDGYEEAYSLSEELATTAVPVYPRLFTADATPEGVVRLLEEHGAPA